MTSANSPSSQEQLSKPVRIGDLLVARGMVTDEQISAALAYQKEKGHKRLLGEVLIELGYVTAEQVTEVLAEAYGVPFAHLNPALIDPKVIETLPREFIDKNNVLPMFCVRGTLTVAVHEPANLFLIEELERVAQMPVQVVAATQSNIAEMLNEQFPDENAFVIDDIVDDIQEGDLTVIEEDVSELTDLEGLAGDSPVIKLVNFVIFSAVKEKASDIHIEPDDGKLRVRYRVDGALYEKIAPPYRMLPAIVSRIKIMSGLDISERRVPQDGAITVMIAKRPVDLRVSTMPGKFGEKVVMRVIDNSGGMVSLEQLGFPPLVLERWLEAVHCPNGVVLVTGPTGSGKSTTLYGSLAEINNDSVNISTVEDPVEFNLPGVNQFQVNEKAGFTFAGALRALLRQDPDIVMLGEIRDEETGRIATQAALTGHLVLSTLHTNDSPSAVTRLYNIGIEPYLVAAAIRAVLAQRLIRRICGNCMQEVELTAHERTVVDRLAAANDMDTIDKMYRGAGCSRCRGTGYAGRVGLYELFVPNDETLDAISRGAGLQELRQIARRTGMTTLQMDGLKKVADGVTSLDELLTVTAST